MRYPLSISFYISLPLSHASHYTALTLTKEREWRRASFDSLAERLGIQKQEDWYELKQEDFKRQAKPEHGKYYFLSTSLPKTYPGHTSHFSHSSHSLHFTLFMQLTLFTFFTLLKFFALHTLSTPHSLHVTLPHSSRFWDGWMFEQSERVLE